MKSFLTGFALLACLAAPALADEAAPAPTTAATTTPTTATVIPVVLPRSTADQQQAPRMSVPLPDAEPAAESASAPGPMGGGCHHGSEQVYLTN